MIGLAIRTQTGDSHVDRRLGTLAGLAGAEDAEDQDVTSRYGVSGVRVDLVHDAMSLDERNADPWMVSDAI